MNYRVTLSFDDKHHHVIVPTVKCTQRHVKLEGADPYLFEEPLRSELQFFSKNLTAFIQPDSPVSVVAIEPTDDDVAEVDPYAVSNQDGSNVELGP